MSKSGDANAQSLVRCVNCPQCGYLLEGLPERGQCPECGFEYSPDVIVLYGSGQGARMTWSTELKMLFAINMLALFALGIAMPLFRNRYMPSVQWGLVVLFALVCAFYRHALRKQMPAEAQLRLTPEGFGLRHGYGEVKMAHWDPKQIITIRRQRFGKRHALLIKMPGFRFIVAHAVRFAFEADESIVAEIKKRIELIRKARPDPAK